MRLAVILSAVAALAAGGALVWLLIRGEEIVPRRGGTEPAALSEAEARAALLGDLSTVGYDEPMGDVTVRREGAGAAFTMPGERWVALTPPEGQALGGEFVILSAASGGFFLGAADGATPPFYVTFVDARRTLEPPDSRAALAVYEAAATRIREVGRLPFLDGALDVVAVTPVPDAVYYCLKRADGMLFQGGTRFVGPLSVTVMRVGDCAPEAGIEALGTALTLAEETLAGNR